MENFLASACIDQSEVIYTLPSNIDLRFETIIMVLRVNDNKTFVNMETILESSM